MTDYSMEKFRMCIYPYLRELYHEAYADGQKNKGQYSISLTEKKWKKIQKALKGWGYWQFLKRNIKKKALG